MKILVTGGAGFIGSHVADAFLAEGHDVFILDNLSTGSLANVSQRAGLYQIDLRDPGVYRLFEAQHFDVLCHHAAQIDVRASVADPSLDVDINIQGLIRLLEAGRKNGLRKVIFASTGGAIYGEPDYTPQDEIHIERPESPYGIDKLAGEHFLRFYAHTYGIQYVALRYANVYGPRQNPHGEAGVVAIFTEQMLAGKQPRIYGDGGQTRDFVYVGDVVQANLAALRYPECGTFNIGTGAETSINMLYRVLADLTGFDRPALHEPGKPGEQRRSVLDARQAETLLGWRPRTTLEEGLMNTVEWFRTQLVPGTQPC